MRPRFLLELGAQRGLPYFAACQAVTDLGLDTFCYSVAPPGTVESDLSGAQELHSAHTTAFGTFSALLESDVVAAADMFEPSSIDLVHLDMSGNGQQAAAWFDAWAPRFSGRAVAVVTGSGAQAVFDIIAKGRSSLIMGTDRSRLGIVSFASDPQTPLERLIDGGSAVLAFLFDRLGRDCRAAADGRESKADIPDPDSTNMRWEETAILTQQIVALETRRQSLLAAVNRARAESLGLKSRADTLLGNLAETLAVLAPSWRGQQMVAGRLSPLERRIRSAGLVDENWYLSQNPDVAAAHVDPVRHYARYGLHEGRLPRDMTRPFHRRTEGGVSTDLDRS